MLKSFLGDSLKLALGFASKTCFHNRLAVRAQVAPNMSAIAEKNVLQCLMEIFYIGK